MRVFAWSCVGSAALALAAGCGGGDEVSPGSSGNGGSGGFITGSSGSLSSSAGSGGDTASASAGSGAGSGTGGGGAGPTCPQVGPFNGPVIDAAPNEWTWIPFPEAKCRNGSTTGIGVRLNPASDKVIIYLEGGGACFNAVTCAASLNAFGSVSFGAWKGTGGALGIFDAKSADNPLKDWNAVYVPYCTGDIHGGDSPQTSVPGVLGKQDFVGYANIGHYLARLVPTFSGASQVLLTGISAGGFGAAYNYDRVAAAFCPIPVTLLDDSGPPMADAYIAPCLQSQWRKLWKLDATLPKDCPACVGADGGGIVNYVSFLGKKYPQVALGLVSSDKDSTISTFFGFGSNDCNLAVPLSGATYSAGLADLRDHYMTPGPFGTYFVDSISHTYLIGPAFFTTSVNGKKLTSWVGDLVSGQLSHVAP